MDFIIYQTSWIALGYLLLALSQCEKFAFAEIDSIVLNGETCMGLERGGHPRFH